VVAGLLRTLIAVAIPLLNFLLLIAVGLDLTVDDFARVRERRAVVAAGLVAPLLLLPPLALGLTWVFQPGAAVTAGILLIAACPIGGISNTYSYLARASTALSVTLTGLSCLAAVVTMPVLGQVFERALGQPFDFSAPGDLLMAQLMLLLVLPVLIGMGVRGRAPHLAERHGPLLRRVAFGGTAAVLTLVILDRPDVFVSELAMTIPLTLAFVVLSTVAGWMTGALVTRDNRDRFTIAAEFGTRNVGVALATAVTLLGRVDFARFAVAYAIVEIPILLGAVALFRRRQLLAGGLASGDHGPDE
jgi:BASS family bile acid:Na+ symporter